MPQKRRAEDRSTALLTLKMTPAERSLFQQVAAAQGMTVSEYVRGTALQAAEHAQRHTVTAGGAAP